MADYLSETGKMFISLIQKPKITGKFLKNPPPKYIYDIIKYNESNRILKRSIHTRRKGHKYFKSDAHHKLDTLQKEINITKIVMRENLDIKFTNILKGE